MSKGYRTYDNREREIKHEEELQSTCVPPPSVCVLCTSLAFGQLRSLIQAVRDDSSKPLQRAKQVHNTKLHTHKSTHSRILVTSLFLIISLLSYNSIYVLCSKLFLSYHSEQKVCKTPREQRLPHQTSIFLSYLYIFCYNITFSISSLFSPYHSFFPSFSLSPQLLLFSSISWRTL